MARSYGLTLVELLVAIAVFSIIASAAYAGLMTVLDTEDHAARQGERLAAVQRTVGALEADLRQALPRDVRSDLSGMGHALTGGPGARDVLLVTRGGWPNPANLDRGTFLRVHWRLEDGELTRSWRNRVDAVQGTPETRRLILTDVDDVELRYLDRDNEWQDRWPPQGTQGTSDSLPRAVEVTLELADWGDIERLFELPPAAYAAPTAPEATADEQPQ